MKPSINIELGVQAECDIEPMFGHPSSRFLKIHDAPWKTRIQATPISSPLARLRLDCRFPSVPYGAGSATKSWSFTVTAGGLGSMSMSWSVS